MSTFPFRKTGIRSANWLAVRKAQREFGYLDRLEAHCADAHAGRIVSTCPACNELQRKAVAA